MTILIAVYMLCSFVLFRNKQILAPSNIVFLSYFLYFVFPSSLFYVFDFFDWEYVLPSGMVNNWFSLSIDAQIDYCYVFTLFFGFTRFLEYMLEKKDTEDMFENYCLRSRAIGIYAGLVFVGAVYFFQKTGGVDAWLDDYSFTYLTKKKGLGELNFFLIMSSNFLAFALGAYVRTVARLNVVFISLILVVLVFCGYLQGIKSRVFIYGIFFALPWIYRARISILMGGAVFSGFVILFSAAMYFRSNGVYRTPEMLLEYFLSYFNTIFLHDIILVDMQSDYFLTLRFPFDKLATFWGVPSEGNMHDISRWLTSIYYPSQWYEESATQQWPIETELYLNYGYHLFWIVPIFIYSAIICSLYVLRGRCGPVFLFIFVAELLMFLSMFRGSMMQWIQPFNVMYYLSLCVLQKYLFVERQQPSEKFLVERKS